jgi:hypothetical protein
MKNKNFAIFILTHGRAGRVFTYKALKKTNYQGKIYFILDDTDKEIEKHKKNFGAENIIIFNKDEAVKNFDIMDNFSEKSAVVYARNESFRIAKELGLTHFLLLDDDYTGFFYRFDRNLNFIHKKLFKLNEVIDLFTDYLDNSSFKSIAMSQAGDFIGGDNGFGNLVIRIRKCMNTFFCRTDRPFKFPGRINEDVNAYVGGARLNNLFLTIPFVSIVQTETQKNPGGLTDIYLNLGTYVKSFYTVMLHPSSVFVAPMGQKYRRLHHRISGADTYPMIIQEKFKNKNIWQSEE